MQHMYYRDFHVLLRYNLQCIMHILVFMTFVRFVVRYFFLKKDRINLSYKTFVSTVSCVFLKKTFVWHCLLSSKAIKNIII